MIQRLAIGITVALLLAGLSSLVWIGGRSLSEIETDQPRTIRIGYAIEAPYAFLDKDGQPTGESPELAKLVIARLQLGSAEWHLTEFQNLIPELLSGEIDVIAAGMFIDDERSKLIAFSYPTFQVTPALLIRKTDHADFLKSGSSALLGDAPIAVVADSVEEKLLLNLGKERSQILAVPDVLTGISAIHAGLVKTMMLSAPTLNWINKNELNQDFMVIPVQEFGDARLVAQGYGGFGFRQTDTELIRQWNSALNDVVGSEAHLKIVEPFGFDTSSIRFTPQERPVR